MVMTELASEADYFELHFHVDPDFNSEEIPLDDIDEADELDDEEDDTHQ